MLHLVDHVANTTLHPAQAPWGYLVLVALGGLTFFFVDRRRRRRRDRGDDDGF